MLTTVKESLSACLVLTKISMNHSDRVLLAKSPQLPEDYSRQMQVIHCFSLHTTHTFFIFLTFYGVAKVMFSVVSVCHSVHVGVPKPWSLSGHRTRNPSSRHGTYDPLSPSLRY